MRNREAASESVILKKVMLEASRLGLMVFRNNIGAYEHRDGYHIKYGVCNPGGSDLIGICRKTGLFVAIEVKAPGGRPSKEQLNFINRINEAGGIGLICDDEKKLKILLAEHINYVLQNRK